jgi:hypothetical protein
LPEPLSSKHWARLGMSLLMSSPLKDSGHRNKSMRLSVGPVSGSPDFAAEGSHETNSKSSHLGTSLEEGCTPTSGPMENL